jgi:peptidyl-prolyl cis-trans isomerase SurA
MKKLIFTLLLAGIGLSSIAQNDPVIMTVAGKEIKKSEFLQVYLKNNNDPKYDQASLDEYMDLFKKLRLKVEEAKSLGYDTLPRLVKELSGYRTQLSTPYMIDKEKSAELVSEGYERMKSEIRASHILIRVSNMARPEDTLKAYNKIIKLRNRIVKGEAFGVVASGKDGSEDQSVSKNGGDLGYFSAFQMVYPFETAAFTTKVGDVSLPVRTQFGYHIIQVEDVREARGKISAAHIMIMLDKKADAATNKDASKEKIDEVYQKLKEGAEFKDMAMKYSEDQSTRPKGGILPQFGTGTKQRMVPEFEEQAFSLKKDGDYSKPFKTQYGWHIVQRQSVEKLKPFADLEKEIEAKVNRDSRSLKTQESFINKLKKQYKFKSNEKKQWASVLKNTDTTVFSGKYVAKMNLNEVLFSFADKKVTISDFLASLMVGQRKVRKEDLNAYLKKKYDLFESNSIKDYEDSQLESKYPAFKALMKEFSDGVLFYEVMNEFVWRKANKDTTGLKTFYEENKKDFMWTERIDAVIAECDNAKIAKSARKMMKKKIPMDSIQKVLNAESKLNIRVSKKKYVKEGNEILNAVELKEGVNKPFELNKKHIVVQVLNFLPVQPKELKEARGEISLAYQNYLEKEWLETLAKKYPIIVKNDVLYSLGK